MIQIITLFLAITGVFSICYHFTDILIFFSEFWEGLKGVFRDLGRFISKESKTNRKDCNLSKLKFDPPPPPPPKDRVIIQG